MHVGFTETETKINSRLRSRWNPNMDPYHKTEIQCSLTSLSRQVQTWLPTTTTQLKATYTTFHGINKRYYKYKRYYGRLQEIVDFSVVVVVLDEYENDWILVVEGDDDSSTRLSILLASVSKVIMITGNRSDNASPILVSMIESMTRRRWAVGQHCSCEQRRNDSVQWIVQYLTPGTARLKWGAYNMQYVRAWRVQSLKFLPIEIQAHFYERPTNESVECRQNVELHMFKKFPLLWWSRQECISFPSGKRHSRRPTRIF